MGHTPFPSDSGTIPTNMQGNTLVADATDDHSLMHRQVGTVINNLATTFGTTGGTNILRFLTSASQFVPVMNASSVFQQAMQGTFNQSVFGSPTATGGTYAGQIQNNGTIANGVYGTAQHTGGTSTNLQINNGTLGTAVFQVWNGWVQANETPAVLGTALSQGVNIGTLQVATGATSKYDKGDKLNFTQGGTNMYMSIYSVPSGTTLLVTGGTDFVPSTGAITNFLYSKSETPNGFPQSFNYTPNETYTGTAPTTVQNRLAKFSVKGNIVFYRFYVSYSGGGSVTQLTINQPIPSNVSASIYHDGGICYASSADNTNFPNQLANAAYTTLFSNTLIYSQFAAASMKAIWVQGFYEI